MTQWAVYHNEKDDAEHISKKSLRRLAAALGVSLADLFLTPTSAVALRAANPLLDEVIELFLAIPSDRQEVYVTILRHITDRPPASTAPPRRSRPKHSRHQQSQGGIAGAQ
jgi:hypothetical protein